MAISERSERAFSHIDNMPPALRECVHEYGYAIVSACLTAGVTRPSLIHNLVREIWAGARQPAQKQKGKAQRASVQDILDWVLIQANSEISAKTLVRLLWANNMAIVAREPTPWAIEASIATISNFDVRVTKREKHRRRLVAAILAESKNLWPYIFEESPGGKATRLRALLGTTRAPIEAEKVG